MREMVSPLLAPSSWCFALTVIAHSHHFLAPLSICVSHFFLLFFWLHWLFVVVCGLSLAVVSRGSSSLQWVGFSLGWLLLMGSMGSRAQQLWCTGLVALQLRTKNVEHSGSGMEPMSWAVAGGLLSARPPGKSWVSHFWVKGSIKEPKL